MKNPFEQVISKEEKDLLINEVGELKSNFQMLQKGTKEQLSVKYPSLTKFFESFLTPDEKSILDTQNKIHAGLNVIEESANFIHESKEQVVNDKKLIEKHSREIEKHLIESTSNSELLKTNLEKSAESLKTIEETKDKLSVFSVEFEQLSAKSDTAKSKLELFEKSIEAVEDSKTKILITQKSTRDLLLEVKTLHGEIFGSEEEDKESGEVVKVEGLVGKLETAYSEVEMELKELDNRFKELQKSKQIEYEKMAQDWGNEFTSLKIKIEGLLPGALSAGLSQAYEEKKNSENAEIKTSSKTFYLAIAGLTLISILPVTLYIYLLIWVEKSFEDIARLAPNVFLAMLPLYIPCLWVAYSSDKRAKLSKRLAEEYAHKSSLSKTFEGISKQVSNISDNTLSATLESKLLYNLIQVSSENPGKLISDYDKSDHPLYEALDKGIAFTESLEKISLIPGIDTIIARVKKRNQKRLEDLSEGLNDEANIKEDGP